MKLENTEERPAIIARLYQVFARYQASAKTMEACSCCVSDADIAALFSAPLSQLSREVLERYASKAMTTWGDETEWKHFLPRLCELALGSRVPGWFEMEWIGNKFSYSNWREWPADEIAAVRDFWHELTVAIARSNDWFHVNWWLQESARLGEDGEADLEFWLRDATSDEIFDLDAWARQWQHLDSPLAKWMRRSETETLLLSRL